MASLADFSQWLEKLPVQLQPTGSELWRVAANQVQRIKERTAQGISVDGTAFAPYSRKTPKQPPVNLFDTGEMLGSITVEASDSEARIFFADPLQAAKAGYNNNGTTKLPQRHFFGVSLQDRDAIQSDIREVVYRRLNG